MLPILRKLQRDNKERKKHHPIYSPVLNNAMTIMAYRLFKRDWILHLSFILYRLRREFGFTDLEVANFSGVPVGYIRDYRRKIKPILKSQILKTLVKVEDNKGAIPTTIEDYSAWFANKL